MAREEGMMKGGKERRRCLRLRGLNTNTRHQVCTEKSAKEVIIKKRCTAFLSLSIPAERDLWLRGRAAITSVPALVRVMMLLHWIHHWHLFGVRWTLWVGGGGVLSLSMSVIYRWSLVHRSLRAHKCLGGIARSSSRGDIVTVILLLLLLILLRGILRKSSRNILLLLRMRSLRIGLLLGILSSRLSHHPLISVDWPLLLLTAAIIGAAGQPSHVLLRQSSQLIPRHGRQRKGCSRSA